MIDKLFGMFSESLLLLKRSYCTAACDRLTEMYVDRRTSCRLDSLQLPRRRYVEPLYTVSYLPLTVSELYNVAYKQVLCSSRLMLHSSFPDWTIATTSYLDFLPTSCSACSLLRTLLHGSFSESDD